MAIDGVSFGGFGTAMVVEQTHRFRAASARHGLYDLVSMYGMFNPARRLADDAGEHLWAPGWAEPGQGHLGVPPYGHWETYQRASPLYGVEHITTPLLVVAGDMDYAAPLAQSEELTRTFRRAWPVLDPAGVVADLWSVPAYLRGCAPRLSPDEVASTGARIVLGNTYHLMLRPGAERIAALGGLHAFTAWRGAMLTDSGGYQVLSLAERRKIDDDGVTFRSHLDGSKVRLGPAESMKIQELLGDSAKREQLMKELGLGDDKAGG